MFPASAPHPSHSGWKIQGAPRTGCMWKAVRVNEAGKGGSSNQKNGLGAPPTSFTGCVTWSPPLKLSVAVYSSTGRKQTIYLVFSMHHCEAPTQGTGHVTPVECYTMVRHQMLIVTYGYYCWYSSSPPLCYHTPLQESEATPHHQFPLISGLTWPEVLSA